MLSPAAPLLNRLAVRQGKIVFSNFNGKGFGCNPKYIALELLRRGIGTDLVWLARSPAGGFPPGVRTVPWGGVRALAEWATAQVIVNNVRMGGFFARGFRKKKGQTYIQTWHGSYGIKKMEADCADLPDRYVRMAEIDSRRTDLLLTNSRWMTDLYRRNFWYDGEIFESGSPRNDILAAAPEPGRIAAIRSTIGLSAGERMVLYAPTFRDRDKDFFPQIDPASVVRALQLRFGGRWVLALRGHPVRKVRSDPPAGVLDVSDAPDVQEILGAADAVITDYSSCAFDFLLTGRPVFAFAPDLREYEAGRGLYYPLEASPFSVALTFGELLENIAAFDPAPYSGKVGDFLREKGSADDGGASGRVAERIAALM